MNTLFKSRVQDIRHYAYARTQSFDSQGMTVKTICISFKARGSPARVNHARKIELFQPLELSYYFSINKHKHTMIKTFSILQFIILDSF